MSVFIESPGLEADSSAALFTVRNLTPDFSYCYSIKPFLVQLCLKRQSLPCLREWLQLSACMRLPHNGYGRQLLACMQNKAMKDQSAGQTADHSTKVKQ